MSTTQRLLAPIALALAASIAPCALADDTAALQAENARLRARVAELERENAQLRGDAKNAEPAIPTRVVERQTDDGSKLWATEPAPIDIGTGRSVHLLWLERAPGEAGGVLWIRSEFSGGIYRNTEQLELRLDGKTETLPIAGYDVNRITASAGRRPQRRDHETVHVVLDARQLAALAETATLSGKLGRTSFTVPAETLASLRALARKTA
jgi:hypothetical protein